MARGRNRSPPGVKGRNQKCVRYDNKRGDNFKVYATFGCMKSIIMKFFHCFIKCYECKARGKRESDGQKKFPELQGVMEKFLPVKPLPADFEERSKADKISALAKLASDQAKEAAGIYERNQASVPLNGGCGSVNQLDNPEGRPPPFSVELPHIDMRFGELDSRSSPIQLPDGTWAKGGGYVATSLELVPRLTGRKRANEGDVYPPVYNGDVDIVQQQPMKWPMEKNSMPPSPLGRQLEGSGTHGAGKNVRSPFSQMLDELGKELLQFSGLVDGGQQHDVLAQEGDDNQTTYPDNVQVGASNATYHDSAGLRVDLRSCPSGCDLEELRVQQFHGTRAKVGGWDACYPQYSDICREDMVPALEKNSMLPSPLGSQLEGIGGEIVGASNSSQIGEREQFPVYLQQFLDKWDAEQGDDIQTNHLDDMQVDEISAADPVSAGCQVDARFSLSRNTPEEILLLPQVGEGSGVGCDAICSHPREVCMEGGNTEPLSGILEGVLRDTGRNRADMEDFYEQLSSLEWLAFEQQHCVEKYWTDPYQYFDDLRDRVNPPNPQGEVNEDFYSIDTFPA